MPNNDNFVTGIMFETNAEKVAKDIQKLDDAQQRVDKNNTKRQKKERTPQEVFAVYAKLLKRYAKQQKDADKIKIKDTKTLLELDMKRFNTMRRMAKLAVTTGAVGWFMGKVSQSAQYGKNLNIAAASTNIDPSAINALAMLQTKYGGGLENATADLKRIESIVLNLQRLGYDNSLEGASLLYPAEIMRMFYDNGNLRTDPIEILSLLQEGLRDKTPAEVQRFAELLGVSSPLVLSLKESKISLDNAIEAEKSRLAIEQKNIDRLAELQHGIEAFDKTFTNEFANSLSSVLGNDFKTDFQNMAKGLAILATLPVALVKTVKWISEKFGILDGLGEALMPLVVSPEEYQTYLDNKANAQGLQSWDKVKKQPISKQVDYLDKVGLNNKPPVSVMDAPFYNQINIAGLIRGFSPNKETSEKLNNIEYASSTIGNPNITKGGNNNTINAPVTVTVNGNIDSPERAEQVGEEVGKALEDGLFKTLILINSGGNRL